LRKMSLKHWKCQIKKLSRFSRVVEISELENFCLYFLFFNSKNHTPPLLLKHKEKGNSYW
jgi:hypothetical protein